MTRKLPFFSLSIVKVATWVILLTLPNPAFCERRGIIIAFTMGGFSRTGLILGYGLTDKLSIEAHLGATACGTGVLSTTVGVSMKYRPIPDNEKFYLLAGWSKVADESPLARRSKTEDELPYRRVPSTDAQGNRYVITGYSAGLNFGLGHEFSINQEKGLAEKVFWAVEGGLYLSLADKQWRITLKDGEKVISEEEGDFFLRKSPFFHTGPIFYSKRD